MADTKRMIQDYEVKIAVHIGDREFIFAENNHSGEPFMVCNHHWDNPLGISIFDQVKSGSSYVEAMSEFIGRLSAAVEKVRDQRSERDVGDGIFTVEDCVPGSADADYTNQLVVIKPESLIASARTADEQLRFAVGGFGCRPTARGKTVICRDLFTGKTSSWERSDVAGVIRPERIPVWARQRLEALDITLSNAQEKAPEPSSFPKVYRASLPEARQNGELEAYKESARLNAECANDIKKAISDSHDGNYHYDLKSAFQAVTAQYGNERVQMVLANTVVCKEYDGRFSHDNKSWARTIPLPTVPKGQLTGFVCETHPAILDGFINHVRKQELEKRPSVADALNAPRKPKPTKEKGKIHHDKER